MTGITNGKIPLEPTSGGGRFPGMDAASQAKHWDDATAAVVMARLGRPPDIRFFTSAEEATASSLCDHLLGQWEEPRVAVVNMIDERLADDQTDGWHYHGMPSDADAWRDSLATLDKDSQKEYGCPFAEASRENQSVILHAVQRLGSHPWHGTPANRLWSLWMRYACTAFYSHPWAWDEIGFGGPAYPRGYKNLGVDRREPFEVADAKPHQDPLRKGRNE